MQQSKWKQFTILFYIKHLENYHLQQQRKHPPTVTQMAFLTLFSSSLAVGSIEESIQLGKSVIKIQITN
jgi:hypothetical protein